MNKAMNTIINKTGYPIFMPNQVLKNNDLNSLVSYLDSQNRLTRTHLIGMGIVCGMEVSSSYQTADAKISISAGCGITSEGYVISLPPITLTHYQSEAKVQSLLFASSEDVSARASLQYTVIELFEQSGDKRISLHQTPEGSERNADGFGEFLADQVLVVVCETQDEQRDSCFLEYDDLGKFRNFRWRFFLLPRVQKLETPEQVSAETLLYKGYQIDQLMEPWKGFATEAIFEARNHFLQEFDLEAKKFQDFAPQVQRFGYVEADDSVDLTKINDYKSFRENYYQICVNAIAAIDNAFPKLFWLFSPFFTTFQPSSGNDFGQLKENLEKRLNSFKKKETTLLSEKVETPEAIYTLQYFYDYLSLLVAAYYELAEGAFDLMDDCTPDTRRFPKFLMLGLVPAISSQPKTGYRSDFTQPPIYNGNQVRVKQVRYLYERLLKLCAEDSFYLLPFYNTPLKITPSKDQSAPLSEQAIPYYLNYPNLYQYWNYDVYRKGRSDRHPAYFYPKQDSQENPHVFNDLTYRLDAYNFYRIEGHIGKANGDALKHIKDYRQRYNLAFDVITLKLGSVASLQDLNISGQFDDLESDFSRIKDTFQKLWTKYASEPKNVLLNTLKQVFFDKPGLTVITSSQLFNPILEIARKPEAHEFVKGDTDLHFRLFVRDETNTHIARFVTQIPSTEGNSLNDFNDLIIDFSGLANDAIAEEKLRIANEIALCLSLGKVTYGIVIDSSSNAAKYHLKLSTKDVVNLPSPTPQYSLVLLSLNHFAVSIDNNNYPAIKQSEFQDFETLYSLLRDVPQEFNTESYHMGNSHAAEELNYFEIKGLINAYQQRLEQLMKLHLFHKFSEQHPGMEHLGGVPKGGTFILVYVDGEEVDELLREDKNSEIYYKLSTLRTETIQKSAALPPDLYQEVISSSQKLFQELQKRKDIVVGDFCLPYRCGSDTPAVNYVVARPRPIIILEKTVFCEGDRKKYQFTLEPEGGTVKGEGVIFEGIKQLFQPSSIDQASIDDLAKGLEVAITFAYAVDDTYDTLTVTIYPKPRPNLSITEGENFCQNADVIEITLTEGTPENVELIQVSINDIQTRILNPRQYAKGGQPEGVRIEALIRDRQTQCENTLSRTVTINPVPEADLSISEGKNFCQNAASVEITLAKGTSEEVELIQVSINDIQTRILNPRQYAKGGQPELVKIEALIRDRQTQCENTLSRTVTINPVPEADLSISEGKNFCQNAASVEITLAKGTSEEVELIQVSINDIQTRILNPRQYAKGGQPELVKIEALIRDRQTQCENTLSRTVTINPVPEADLSISEGENFCQNAASVEITLAKGTSEEVELIQVSINDIQTRILNPRQYAKGGQPELVKIEALIGSTQTQCENTLSRTVTINPVPEADFQAEIANINGQGFSIRVFNIQPTEKSFRFVWEHLGGSSNISNPNSEFIITYNFDFNTWVAGAEVSITLRVNTPPTLGNCSSEPVTKRIAIPFGGVVGFNLLTISNNQVLDSTTLESDCIFRISDFNRNNEYAIAAVTIPATLGSVIFTYTAPNASTEVSLPVNGRPYHLPNWQPIVGIHRITAQAFREINGDRLEGTASSVILRINDSETDTDKPTQPTPNSATLLNRLRVLFQTSGKNIAESKAIRYEYKIKPTQVLVLSVASLLLIVGWTYTSSKQPQHQQNSPSLKTNSG
ncbi:hypothetical protein H6G81_07770 [Scytonema hofmannii FACHB-248]|uniref:Uncharacterized protein n=1 Tax=Scytonema hofmannii FACHB-248 TaxID=1842502 RepID=A0ABR8GMY7_9CYAN|nr:MULTISPECIES: hypothetical protein [Nostocales]MBD2604430.1 hypothetical protein [Scytonema hofmannii FACHB-248]